MFQCVIPPVKFSKCGTALPTPPHRAWTMGRQRPDAIMGQSFLNVMDHHGPPPRAMRGIVSWWRCEENLALEDATGYELLMVLQDRGWHWGKWVSMGQRKKGTPAIPVGFEPGSPNFIQRKSYRAYTCDHCLLQMTPTP